MKSLLKLLFGAFTKKTSSAVCAEFIMGSKFHFCQSKTYFSQFTDYFLKFWDDVISYSLCLKCEQPYFM